MSIEEIYHYLSVSDRLATGGQPTEWQLRELASVGFEVDVNLGLTGTEYALPDEAGLARSLGMTYHHLPIQFSAPTGEDLRGFLHVMDSAAKRRVFVHCAANYRVACFVALYARLRLGWSAAEARRHIRLLWEPDEVWEGFLRESERELGLAPEEV